MNENSKKYIILI